MAFFGLICWIIAIDFQMLNQPCILRIPVGHDVLFFSHILLDLIFPSKYWPGPILLCFQSQTRLGAFGVQNPVTIFSSIFISNTSLQLHFLVIFFLFLHYGVSCLLKQFVWDWYYFFLKCVCNSPNKPELTFSLREVLVPNYVSLIYADLFEFSISSGVSIGNMLFQRL